MFDWSSYNKLFVILCGLIVHAQLPAPFDLRIDHHKVYTTRDLIINTPRPQFSWKIRTVDNNQQRNVQQIAYQMQLQTIQLSARDSVYKWDSQRVLSSQSIHVTNTGSSDLLPARYYQFRLRIWVKDADEPSEWAEWIKFRTAIFDLHEYLINLPELLWIGSTEINMNELRKEFSVPNASPIKSAIVYMTGIGYYEFYLNGNKVDPSRKLDPGWTTYEKRTLIVSYDVTANITTGMNAIGVKLGNGWYSAEQHGEENYGPPRLLFTMSITFQNGDQMQVLSDQTWTGREGSIKHDSVYNGEMYDSRSDRLNWSRPGFVDPRSAWIMPDSMRSPINGTPVGILSLQDIPPIRAGPEALHFEVEMNNLDYSYLTREEIGEIQGASLVDSGLLKPVDTWLSASTNRIFDLGQNLAGWCRLRFQGRTGYGTSMRHGEILVQQTPSTNHSTRNIFIENLRNATATDSYILRGDPANETYEPTFTVHGFRYLSIFGSPSLLTLDDVECVTVHTETTLVGHFTSSNPIINQIQHNIQWSQLSNIMSVPTDCPQRDERRGWMGDAALAIDEALYNFDLFKFFQNFLNLIVDMQRDNGQIPSIVPGGIWPGDPNWSTALPTITWQLYRHSGDSKILEMFYDHIRAYVESLRSAYNQTGLINFYFVWGDWSPPSPYPQTNSHLISSFAILHDVDLLLNMSQVLNRTNDTIFYSEFYQQLAEEFHRVFFNTTMNFYADGMQAAQVLALALRGVVPTNLRQTIVDHLVSDINQKGNHATTGIVSTAQLYPLLSDNGHHDLALEIISSTTYPSFGYMFNNPYENATTLWEHFEALFFGVGGSRNHIMFGSVGAWFYSHLAGINLSSDIITIRPKMASENKKHLMNKLDCQLSTLYGLLHIVYTRDERDTVANSIRLRVKVPPNTKTRVQFEPLFSGGQCVTLMESNATIWSSDSTVLNRTDLNVERDPSTDLMTVYLGSGHYEFQALWK